MFKRPPVSEVRIAIVFNPINIPVTRLGGLMEELSATYPKVEERFPRANRVSRSSGSSPTVRVQLGSRTVLPLIRFSSNDGSRIVDLQSDSLALVWRRTASDPYPQYVDLRRAFLDLTKVFESFCDENLPDDDIYLVEAEISYLNLFEIAGDDCAAAVASVSGSGSGRKRDSLLPPLSSAGSSAEYTFNNSMEEKYASLRVRTTGRARSDVGSVRLQMRLTFSGDPFVHDNHGPDGEDLTTEGIIRFLDEGHDAIVRAFASETSPKMHRIWSRVE